MSFSWSQEDLGRWVAARAKELRRDLGPLLRARETDLQVAARRHRGLSRDVDPHDLRQTGWGVIVPGHRRDQLLRLLKPLIDRREPQASTSRSGRKMCRIFDHRRGRSASIFLREHGQALSGVIDPEKLPYYLLIIGGPDEIPFDFQYQLSYSRAVGRLAFKDPSDYGRYARAVARAEEEGSKLPRETVLFSVEDGSDATRLLTEHFVLPMRLSLDGYLPGWKLKVVEKSAATHGRLGLLFNDQGPALLLASCHGHKIKWETSHQEEQEALQGALRCHPDEEGKRLFTAADVSPTAELTGQIAFLLACYGAGTPKLDNYPHEGRQRNKVLKPEPQVLSDRPFIARLPQVLLARGALAVVGHVDRGWTLSYAWAEHKDEAELPAVASFEDSVKRLLWGDRLGHALRPMVTRYTSLAARLANLLDLQRSFGSADLELLGVLFTATNDARNFILLGDPSVYILGQRSFLAETAGLIKIDNRALPLVVKAAAVRQMSVEGWLNQVIRRELRRR